MSCDSCDDSTFQFHITFQFIEKTKQSHKSVTSIMSSVSLKSDVIMWPKREKLSTCSLTLLLLLLLAYAKKDLLSSLIFIASFGFKLFLSFFYQDFSLSLALDNACCTNYGGRRRLPPDVGRTNYRPTAPTGPT